MNRTRSLLLLAGLGALTASALLLPGISEEASVPSTPTTLDPGLVWMMTGGQMGTPPPTVTPMTLDQILSGGLP